MRNEKKKPTEAYDMPMSALNDALRIITLLNEIRYFKNKWLDNLTNPDLFDFLCLSVAKASREELKKLIDEFNRKHGNVLI